MPVPELYESPSVTIRSIDGAAVVGDDVSASSPSVATTEAAIATSLVRTITPDRLGAPPNGDLAAAGRHVAAGVSRTRRTSTSWAMVAACSPSARITSPVTNPRPPFRPCERVSNQCHCDGSVGRWNHTE